MFECMTKDKSKKKKKKYNRKKDRHMQPMM